MSDTTASGSAGQGANPGASTSTVGSGLPGETAAPGTVAAPAPATAPVVADWRQHIPEEFKTADFWGAVKDTPDLVKQFAHQQKLVGADKVVLPKKDWTPADWDGFYQKLGRPATVSDYKATGPDGKNLLDDDTAKTFSDAAFKVGLSQHQFATMAAIIAEQQGTERATEEASVKETLTNFGRALREKHGDNLPAVLDTANKALVALGDENLTALLTSDARLANHPSIIDLLSRMSVLMGEDTMRTTGVSPSAHTSPGSALVALKQFESENATLIHHKNPATLSLADQNRRNALIAERGRLFKSAYPQS